jgi:hypothetical protein
MQSHSDRNATVRQKKRASHYIFDFTDSLAKRGYFKECMPTNSGLRERSTGECGNAQTKMEGFTGKRIQGFIRHRAKRYAPVRERHAHEARCVRAATGTGLSETRGQIGSVLSSGTVIGDAPCGVKPCSQLMMATAESGNGR